MANNKQLSSMKNKYFFCYSPTLHKYLNKVNQINYICAAINEANNKKFWLYEQDTTLSKALTDYNKLFKGGEVN